jgi:hypothetical protein
MLSTILAGSAAGWMRETGGSGMQTSLRDGGSQGTRAKEKLDATESNMAKAIMPAKKLFLRLREVDVSFGNAG